MVQIKRFIGRKKELEQFTKVLEEPKGQAVIIVGAKGSGKSALLEEILKAAKASEVWKCDTRGFSVRPSPPVSELIRNIGEWRLGNDMGKVREAMGKGRVAYTPQNFKKILEASLRGSEDNVRVVIGIDLNVNIGNRNRIHNWTDIVGNIPEKVKLIITQRPDDVLVKSKTFMNLPSVVRIPEGALEAVVREPVNVNEGVDVHIEGPQQDATDRGDDDSENVFRDNLIAFLITEKGFPRESLNHGMLAEAPDLDLTVNHPDPDVDEFLATFSFNYENNPSFSLSFTEDIGGADKTFYFIVSPSTESNEDFVIMEMEDDGHSNDVSYEDFPTYDQLLFAWPLSDSGRRTYRKLFLLAKHKHGLSIHVPCQDYINLQIKKNKRTAAQIHRLKDTEDNIALVLAGYQEKFPLDERFEFLTRGNIGQLSGYTNKYPGERNWLEGKLGHPYLKYSASVIIIKPVLVLDEIEAEVVELLELAKKNAGGGILKEFIGKIVKVFGRIATLRSDEVSDVDDLGRDTLVDSLADTLIGTDFNNGFTVALLGNWGEGKSSVMEILKKRLRERKKGRFDFALFNAWEYEQTKKTATGLAQEVVKGLREKNWFKKQWQRIRFAWKENKLSVLILAGFIISPFLLYFLKQHYDLALLTDYLKKNPNVKELLDGVIKVLYFCIALIWDRHI